MAYITKSESSFKCQEIDAGRTLLLAAFDELDLFNNTTTPEVDLVTRVLALTKRIVVENTKCDPFVTPFIV